MIKRIKKILREIFAPNIVIHKHYISKNINSKDWKKVEGNFDSMFKHMGEMFEDMGDMFKKL
jgi:hypothetical protein